MSSDPEASQVTPASSTLTPSRLQRKKFAILFGYNGNDFSGLQFQPDDSGSNAIENVLLPALYRAGLVSEDNASDPEKNGWTRAARTDIGVSAVRQVVSCKLIAKDRDEALNRLNELLPASIRIWDLQVVTKHFNARRSCDERIYEYTFPTYVFRSPPPDAFYGPDSKVRHLLSTSGSQKPMPQIKLPELASCDVEPTHNYRTTSERLNKFQEAMHLFVGHHNFRNYTIRENHCRTSLKRRVISIQVQDPRVHRGVEWVTVRLHGESFILHQIRKMIGLAILVVRTETPPKVVSATFGDIKIGIPKAPALGLYLEETIFRGYNTVDKRRVASGKDPLNFDAHVDAILRFKEDLLQKIRNEEMEHHSYAHWLRNVDSFSSAYASFLNASGEISLSIIPESPPDAADED
ncbi:pseudouridine synthase [Phlyctochytrium arcticum]|nr:pseudouridine synthase [Phlyctochytrium arcticum]